MLKHYSFKSYSNEENFNKYSNNEYYGQSGQDKFVLKCLNNKKNGTFLEIGTNNPIIINNTYLLESQYNWKGLMIEYDNVYSQLYDLYRQSPYIIQDARTINYINEFEKHNFPKNIDYLQIDLEVSNKSTLETLEILNNTVMNTYKFAVITFEHDICSGDHFNTRTLSREIFNSRGYIRVFSDVNNWNPGDTQEYPYEDWYVHPELVDMTYINQIKNENSLRWKNIIDSL